MFCVLYVACCVSLGVLCVLSAMCFLHVWCCFLFLVFLGQGKTLLKNMYDMFVARDCTLVEINPLAETPDGRGECLAFCCILEYDE